MFFGLVVRISAAYVHFGRGRSPVPARVEKRGRFYLWNKRTHRQARPPFAGSLLAHRLPHWDRSR